jgi:glycosyltransferase involved in cell wall biosynthesis
MRILLAADTFPPDVNGAAHFTDRLARGLAARGHDVHVLCPAESATPGTTADGVLTVHRVKSRRTPFHPTFRFSTPRQAAKAAGTLLDRLRPDVIHVQSHFPVGRSVVWAAIERGVPVIATNHFMPENLLGFVPAPERVRSWAAAAAWRDLVRVYRQAAVVTAPTPRAVELLADKGFLGKARAISCGIDLAHYATRRTVGGTDISVLFVGRLDREKNVGELLRAVAAVPTARAEIVGDGSCRRALTEEAERLGVAGRVRFHGFVGDEDLVRAYREADVFCMPGTAELQSLATMEAMAAGLPVVAADAMALPHLVRSGVNGFLYPPGDVERLAAALGWLAGNAVTRAAMGHASRQTVARHDLAGTLDAFEDVYRESAGLPAVRRLLAS